MIPNSLVKSIVKDVITTDNTDAYSMDFLVATKMKDRKP